MKNRKSKDYKTSLELMRDFGVKLTCVESVLFELLKSAGINPEDGLKSENITYQIRYKKSVYIYQFLNKLHSNNLNLKTTY